MRAPGRSAVAVELVQNPGSTEHTRMRYSRRQEPRRNGGSPQVWNSADQKQCDEIRPVGPGPASPVRLRRGSQSINSTLAHQQFELPNPSEIGRASCREREEI